MLEWGKVAEWINSNSDDVDVRLGTLEEYFSTIKEVSDVGKTRTDYDQRTAAMFGCK